MVTNLQPNLILQRAPNIKIFINSSTDIEILINEIKIKGGKFTLLVLDAFSYPASVSQTLKNFQGQLAGTEDWIALTTTIAQFYDSGVLLDETQVNSSVSSSASGGFDTALMHTLMLNDRARTSAYFAGISEVVKPGDVVVDIGTGTGILAMGAARAGAKHVYAIEATGIGETAKALFEANGLADRITLLSGWSTQVELPERADVMVSEIIGNEPLGERVLETTIDARKRLLKPDARLIPGKLKIMGLPITIPDTELAKMTFTEDTLRNWQASYGINFDPLKEIIQNAPQTFFVKPQKAKDWTVIGNPVLLADVDFKTVKQTMIDNTVEGYAEVKGELNGMLIYFELELGPNAILSTHPARADKDNHWLSVVWILTNNLTLQTGDRFNVSYRYRVSGRKNHLMVEKI